MIPELEKPKITEIKVRMDCNGCVHKIKKALYGINGIYDLYIDFPQQKLTIIGWADSERIMKAIKKTRKIATICSDTEHTADPNAAQPIEHTPHHGGEVVINPPSVEVSPQSHEVVVVSGPNGQSHTQVTPGHVVVHDTHAGQHSDPTNASGQVHVTHHQPPEHGHVVHHQPPEHGHVVHHQGPDHGQVVHHQQPEHGHVVHNQPPEHGHGHVVHHHQPEHGHGHVVHHQPDHGQGHVVHHQPSEHGHGHVVHHHQPEHGVVVHNQPPEHSHGHGHVVHNQPPEHSHGHGHVVHHQPPEHSHGHGQGHVVHHQASEHSQGPGVVVHQQPPEPSHGHVVHHHQPEHGRGHSSGNRYHNSQGVVHEAPPVTVTHSYNTYKPSPYVTEYLRPLTRQKPSPYASEHGYVRTPQQPTHYSPRMDRYSEDYNTGTSSNNGNITSIFSDENPNACSVM